MRHFPTVLMAVVIGFCYGCTSVKTIVYNLANHKDYKRFPNDTIASAEVPFVFTTQLLRPEDILVEKQVKNKRKIVPLADFLESTKNIAFLIIRNDTLLFEKYGRGYEASSRVSSFSISKSMISSLVAIALEEGLLHSTEDKLVDYLPELKSKPGFDQIALEHLLNHTSGLKFNESYVNPFASDVAKFYYGANLHRLIKRLKIEEAPGHSFHYHSANTQLIAIALTRATGKSIAELFHEKIWSKIGTSSTALWSKYRKPDIQKAFCCVNATPTDFAKFGRLMAQKGDWNGEQIIPVDWFDKATPNTQEGSIWSYQNHWVVGLKAYGDLMAQGLYDQYIYVIPNQKLIIVSFNAAHLPSTDWVNLFRRISDQL